MNLPDFTTQDNTEYKAAIDATAADHEGRLTILYGVVNADGTLENYDGVMSVTARIATGSYRLTHNFSSAEYNVQITPEDSGVASFHVLRVTNDYFEVYFYNSSGVLIDAKFGYTAKKY